MTKLLVRLPAASRQARAARPRLSTRNLGYLGLGWALAYIPVHVYWALGGLSTPIGITGHQPGSAWPTGVRASSSRAPR